MNFESEVIAGEKKVMERYGFDKGEVNRVMKNKPTFLLFEQEYENKKIGLLALENVLVT